MKLKLTQTFERELVLEGEINLTTNEILDQVNKVLAPSDAIETVDTRIYKTPQFNDWQIVRTQGDTDKGVTIDVLQIDKLN